ncbi:tRNA-specific adenosine deaminase 1 [Cladochytrium tenue]|nr:tRNA-specific adenosine deaminase 1 [Cladochytrium tenue]
MEYTLTKQTDQERTENEGKKRRHLERAVPPGRAKLGKIGPPETELPAAFVAAQARGPLRRGRMDPDMLGCLRTKPGRIDSEVSLSMSDKIARWSCLGLGGAVLSHVCEPVYLSSLTVGEGYDETALKRAIVSRIEEYEDLPTKLGYKARKLDIFQTSLVFDSGKSAASAAGRATVTAPCAIGAFLDGKNFSSEVVANGRKLGASPRNGKWDERARPRISKYSIARRALKVCELAGIPLGSTAHDKTRTLTYGDLKAEAKAYREARAQLLGCAAFRAWVASSCETEGFALFDTVE